MKDLSAKQQRIPGYIRDFFEDHDYPIRQIQNPSDINSTSVVDNNLHILDSQGHISRDREVSRDMDVLQIGRRAHRVVPVPIIGTIAAGEPIPVPTDSTDMWDSIEVAPEMVGDRDNVFALRVKGTSMIDALINDGDIVIFEQTGAASDGDMVAAWLKSERTATLMRIFREGDRVRLQPANETMQPIYTDAGNVEVQGRVIGSIRRQIA